MNGVDFTNMHHKEVIYAQLDYLSALVISLSLSYIDNDFVHFVVFMQSTHGTARASVFNCACDAGRS